MAYINLVAGLVGLIAGVCVLICACVQGVPALSRVLLSKVSVLLLITGAVTVGRGLSAMGLIP